MLGKPAAKAILKGDTSYNMGAVIENVVAEGLMKKGYEPRYYRKMNGNNRMELDFVIELDDHICAIEVKSGKTREYPSLMKSSKVFNIDRLIVFENSNILENGNGVEHYPLFVSAFIDCLEPEWDGPEL